MNINALSAINLYGIPSAIVSYGIGFLILALFVQVVLSLFRIDERNPIMRFLTKLTYPLLEPVRRIVGNVGVFDLSFLIVFFLLFTLRSLLLQALPPLW
jgi:YggT family protein